MLVVVQLLEELVDLVEVELVEKVDQQLIITAKQTLVVEVVVRLIVIEQLVVLVVLVLSLFLIQLNKYLQTSYKFPIFLKIWHISHNLTKIMSSPELLL